MNKKKSKVLAFLLAAALIVPSANGTIYAAKDLKEDANISIQRNVQETEVDKNQSEVNYVAMIGNQSYKTLKEAFAAAPTNGEQVRIVIQKDIKDIKTDDIATLDKGKNVVLDMNGKSITVASDFVGRPIVNRGTMVVTGNGKIDSSNSESGGYGAINNYGDLTIEDGEFYCPLYSNGASIFNRNTGNLVVKNGTFGNMKAIYNNGKVYIYDGIFKSGGCSYCDVNNMKGYVLTNVSDSSNDNPEMYIYGGTITGTRGIAPTSGKVEIYDCNVTAHKCPRNPNHASYYALYIAGGSGEVNCNIYGGTFISENTHAAHVGNNKEIDGGLREKANAKIYGGTFKTGTKNALHADETLGSIKLAGGNFIKNDGNKADIEKKWIPEDEKGNKLFTQNEDGRVVMSEHNENKDCTLTKVEAKEPTCTSEGNIEYYICENHGLYKDASHSEKIDDESKTKIAKLQHVFGEWVISGENKTRKCDNCSETETAPAGVAIVNGKAYDSLEAAIAASNEKDTIKLLQETEIKSTINLSGKNLRTIDFNGKMVRASKDFKGESLFKIEDTKDISLKNGNFEINGEAEKAIVIENSTAKMSGEFNANKGTDKVTVAEVSDSKSTLDVSGITEINGKKDPQIGDNTNNKNDIVLDGGANKDDNIIDQEISSPSIPSTPSKPSKPVYTHEKIAGSDRYDTAAKIADKLGSYDTAVLINATSTMSDGLSASGLAGKENGAILLTKKDSIPKVTMDRLKKVKKVYIIGGENAISAKVANEITAAGIKVERIGGKTRVETSELVAKKLGNYKKAFVVNGFKGEADAMSASSVAAKNGAPILLTNGKTSTHAKKSGVSYYVVGGNNVVNKSIADKYNAEVLAGDDRYETNREVINEFYGESETLYFANGETLVDALTASTLSKDDGLVLVGRKSDNKILNKKNTIQVGGMKFDVDFEK